MPAEIRRLGPGVTEIRQAVKSNTERRYLYAADVHLDNPKCDRTMLKRHLDMVKAEDALAFFFGDLFDAMQGRDDRRGEKGDVDPVLQSSKHWNAVVDMAADFLAPYAKHIAVISEGNHETAIRKRLEVDLIAWLVQRLNDNHGGNVQHMGYEGWIHHYYYNGSNKAKATGTSSGSNSRRLVTHYNHGTGGGGVVTKGVINTNRRSARVRGADVMVYGHIHEAWMLETIEAESLSSGRVALREVIHLQLPTYKQEYVEQGTGFHHERCAPPKPLGAWWLYHEQRGSDKAWYISARRAR